MSLQYLVRSSQIKKLLLLDYVHPNSVKKLELMSYNMMIDYDIYDRFTMEHFALRQRMTLTLKTKFIARDCTYLIPIPNSFFFNFNLIYVVKKYQ
jgi:hypothetical protein